MEFIKLADAALKLNTTVNNLLGLASDRKITICSKIPDDVDVMTITSSSVDRAGNINLAPVAKFTHLDIPDVDLRFTDQQSMHNRLPVYFSGYLEYKQKHVHYHNLKIIERSSDQLHGIQPWTVSIIGMTSFCPTPINSDATPIPSKHVFSGIPITPELVDELYNLYCRLVCIRKGCMVRLELLPSNLFIPSNIFTLLRNQMTAGLPRDEMLNCEYATDFMRDMNLVAREMYALAIRNDYIYPKPEAICSRILEMPSFKKWANSEVTDFPKTYKDLHLTATQIIRPIAALGKGHKRINRSSSYMSEHFKILIEACKIFGPKFQCAIKPSIGEVTEWLINEKIGTSIAPRAAPIIWPNTARKAGRRPGIKNSIVSRESPQKSPPPK